MPVYRNPILRDGRPLLTGVAFGVPNTIPERVVGNYTALLDTGTYHTLVGQGVVEDLGLHLIEPDEIIANFRGATGSGEVRVYRNVVVVFPQDKRFEITIHCSGQRYATGVNASPFHLAIGMDILSQGIFCLNGFNNEYALTFPD